MPIKYLCYDCSKKSSLTGFRAVNQVGRKFCDNCGSNDNYLIVVSEEEYNKAIQPTQKNCSTCNGSGQTPCPDGFAVCRECLGG